ncbi:uncharacterized protein LY79DRAFT_536393 [Colletotrichum navitas]|uniref:Uncharacterized protein n=1 Tax=Colletotrichum navitas TaxID=681940 RepID=A0AAD8QB18_9PEZI|nr:uncharacterized protein LY79DRAFT_536393 [Colletotrichum navitas]KAK1598914.1 hypothetical protein LY79DRAFT_536393 [Colletotrichum navitas]
MLLYPEPLPAPPLAIKKKMMCMPSDFLAAYSSHVPSSHQTSPSPCLVPVFVTSRPNATASGPIPPRHLNKGR